MNAKWSVLAVYENDDARAAAMKFCDALIQRFWTEMSFDLAWCKWSGLEEPGGEKAARQKAGAADLIIMATCPNASLPPQMRHWLEQALHHRREREGVLVGLPLPETGLSSEAATTQVYLRKLAHQSGMDYLSSVPESLPRPEPESLDSYRQRATEVTSVLDTILHHAPLPFPPRML